MHQVFPKWVLGIIYQVGLLMGCMFYKPQYNIPPMSKPISVINDKGVYTYQHFANFINLQVGYTMFGCLQEIVTETFWGA